jgi:hypothetical protein
LQTTTFQQLIATCHAARRHRVRPTAHLRTMQQKGNPGGPNGA